MPKPRIHDGRNDWFPRIAAILLLATAQLATNSIAADKDKWSNPAESNSGHIRFEGSPIAGRPQSYQFLAEDGGYHRFEHIEIPASSEFVLRVFDTAEQNLAAKFYVMAVRKDPDLKLYCGDLHGQHLRDSASVEQYAGDEDGIVLSLDAPASAILKFDGSVKARNQFGEDAGNFWRVAFSIPIGELTQTEAVLQSGGLVKPDIRGTLMQES